MVEFKAKFFYLFHISLTNRNFVMPQATKEEALSAINDSLSKLNPPGDGIESLETVAMSDPNWSCNNFSPEVLEQICAITNTPLEDLDTTEYPANEDLPDSFPDGTFVNISMMGEPSTLNHNFNILVSGGTTYLIQVFINFEVNIVRRFDNATFIEHWHNLANNENWASSYNELFGVDPNEVVGGQLPANTWLLRQYVSQ